MSANLTVSPFADYHMHLTSAEVAAKMIEKLGDEILMGYRPSLHGADEIISVLDRNNTQKAFALSNAYQWAMDELQIPPQEEYEQVRFENDFTARECAKYPDRLYSFLSINPRRDYAIEEIDRCVKDLGLKGLKLHFTNSNVDLRDPEHLAKLQKVLAHADELGLPVLIHFLSRNPEFGYGDATILMDEIVSQHPGLKVSMAHLGCGGFYDKTIDVLTGFIDWFEAHPDFPRENFVMDIAAVISDGSKPLTLPITEEQAQTVTALIRRWGVERTLFATDWPIFEPLEYVEMLKRKTFLTEEELNTILSNHWVIG
jgi:predicted TIM-barrel fold metal-dependent hydrolase